MEKTPRFWLNIRERYCQKQTLPISESVPFKPMNKSDLYATFVSRTLALSDITFALKSVQSNLYVPKI